MKEKILEFLEELCPLEDIEEDTLLIDEGIIDSLGIVALIGKIENEWGITISDQDVTPIHFSTCSAICEMLETYGI